MAATVTVVNGVGVPIGRSQVRDDVEILMDSSYPTGGEPITGPGTRGYLSMTLAASGGYVPEWDRAAQKLKVYRQSAATAPLAEVANAVDLSAVIFRGSAIRST